MKQSRIYSCPECSNTYLYWESSKVKGCESCKNTTLNGLEDWESLICEKCNMQFDVSTFQMHGNLGRVDQGLIKCKYCDIPLKAEK